MGGGFHSHNTTCSPIRTFDTADPPPYWCVQPPAHQDRTGTERERERERGDWTGRQTLEWLMFRRAGNPLAMDLSWDFVFCSFEKQSGGWRPGLYGTMLLDSSRHSSRHDSRSCSVLQDTSALHPWTKPGVESLKWVDHWEKACTRDSGQNGVVCELLNGSWSSLTEVP